MRVRSELDGREWKLDRDMLVWVPDGWLPRTGRVHPNAVMAVQPHISPAPGQQAWVRVTGPNTHPLANDEWMFEPVTMLEDGRGVDSALNPHRYATPEALRIADLQTDTERQWALEGLMEKNMGEWMETGMTVGNLLAWRRDAAVFCTGVRERSAEIEEADSVSTRW